MHYISFYSPWTECLINPVCTARPNARYGTNKNNEYYHTPISQTIAKFKELNPPSRTNHLCTALYINTDSNADRAMFYRSSDATTNHIDAKQAKDCSAVLSNCRDAAYAYLHNKLSVYQMSKFKNDAYRNTREQDLIYWLEDYYRIDLTHPNRPEQYRAYEKHLRTASIKPHKAKEIIRRCTTRAEKALIVNVDTMIGYTELFFKVDTTRHAENARNRHYGITDQIPLDRYVFNQADIKDTRGNAYTLLAMVQRDRLNNMLKPYRQDRYLEPSDIDQQKSQVLYARYPYHTGMTMTRPTPTRISAMSWRDLADDTILRYDPDNELFRDLMDEYDDYARASGLSFDIRDDIHKTMEYYLTHYYPVLSAKNRSHCGGYQGRAFPQLRGG